MSLSSKLLSAALAVSIFLNILFYNDVKRIQDAHASLFVELYKK